MACLPAVDNFKGYGKMKIRGKWVIVLTVFSAGIIIIGSLTNIIPYIANSSLNPFNEIQTAHKNVRLETSPNMEINTCKEGSQIKSISKSDTITEKISVKQTCTDNNEQEVNQIQHVNNDNLENDEYRLVTKLKEEEENEIKRLNAELVELDVYVSEQKKEIERWYTSELERLKVWAESRTKELDGEAQLAFARCLQKINNTVSSSISSFSSDTSVYSNTEYSPYGYSSTDSYARINGRNAEVTLESVVGNPSEDFKMDLENIKEGHRAVKDVFEELLKKREQNLYELEAYAVRKREAIDAQKRSVVRSTKVKLSGGPGLIDAISFTDKEQFIVFSGEILREGDYANGFKIIKIHNDRVEFEKDGKVWIQEL
jgi:hypothetical protein